MESRVYYNTRSKATFAENVETSVLPLRAPSTPCVILFTAYLHDFGVEASVLKPSPQHLSVDVVDGGDAREDQVEHEEVTLQSVGDIILSSARVTHGTNVLQVLAYLGFFGEIMSSSSRNP